MPSGVDAAGPFRMASTPLPPIAAEFGVAASVRPKHEAPREVQPVGRCQRKIGWWIGSNQPQIGRRWMADIQSDQRECASRFNGHSEGRNVSDEARETVHSQTTGVGPVKTDTNL